jgi:hypothetical protein
MRILFTLFVLWITTSIHAQDKPNDLARPIVEEGKRLYRSEMASWYGTDLFTAQYKNQENIGGYFSYTENNMSKCIFFSKEAKPKVIGTISLDSTYNTATATVDLTERDFLALEKDLFTIRKNAMEVIVKDSLFKQYKNTNLNLIPLITGEEKKLYILTGPQQTGVVIFGNDYLLIFDADNQVISKKQLHKNIIAITYAEKPEKGKEVATAMHNHTPETGDFITATDICTLLLYEKFAKWKQHTVISKNYMSIWNCSTNELTVLPMETIQKIYKDQEKRNKKKGN